MAARLCVSPLLVDLLVMYVGADLVRCHEMTKRLLLFDQHEVDQLSWEWPLT